MLFPSTFRKREASILLEGLMELIETDHCAVSSDPCHNDYFGPEPMTFAQLVASAS